MINSEKIYPDRTEFFIIILIKKLGPRMEIGYFDSLKYVAFPDDVTCGPYPTSLFSIRGVATSSRLRISVWRGRNIGFHF